MTQVRDAIHEHHAALLDTITASRVELSRQPASFDSARLVEFLNKDLLPHAKGEEESMYPAVEPLIKAHGQATATMSMDHRFIEDYVRRIETAATELAGASPDERPACEKQLERLLWQLEALFEVHLAKEEQIYLPLFEQYLPDDEQKRILDGMHEVYDAYAAVEKVIDVRPIPPARRHALIFETFDALADGASFQLINDHDPKPLYYQFMHERAGQFTWEYLQAGPRVWRVTIGRVK